MGQNPDTTIFNIMINLSLHSHKLSKTLSKNKTHVKLLSSDYNRFEFICLHLVLLHLYDTQHRIYCMCIINFENF